MRKKMVIMLAVMSAMFFSSINITIIGTSLPKIVAAIGGMEYFNWAFTIFMLTSSITASLVGKLSDIYGRKIFLLAGICIFMIGSLLCGFSGTIGQLIMFRGIQGFGGGMIMSSAFTTMGDLFAPRERARWQGVMAGMLGVSSLFGPTLGGYVVDRMDWSWVFWMFLPIGAVAFFMIFKLYPQVKRKPKEKIDYLGAFVLSIAILSILLGFSWAGTEYSWISVEIIGLFFVSFVSLSLLIVIEKRAESPVIPLYLFKHRVVTISCMVLLLFGMGLFGLIMYIPFYVQGVLGKSATTSGIMEMIMTVSMVLCSAAAGQYITRTGRYKALALVGFSLMTLGLFMISQLASDTELSLLTYSLIVCGIGIGFTMPVFTLTVQNAVEHKDLGVATACVQMFRQMGGTIGVSVMGFILTSRMAEKLSPPLISPMEENPLEVELNPQHLMNAEAMEDIKSQLSPEMLTSFEQFISLSRDALDYALTEVFLFATIVVALAFLATTFLKELPLRTSNEEQQSAAVGNEQSL
ncbi:MDR family MFS transporter [Ammoniphilus sp. YIM 78166]|uniref:MDR family MFS transporter n=1 Tax=Ammoniphilus sp. YIM 78166 TaxID=1644106 RepID=UPI001F0E86E8|nr:MDR family MFS transporter [Ammoniphilus sp. YIM 78166]